MAPDELRDALVRPEVLRAIQEDALDRYPEEACGAVTPDGYERLDNVSPAPKISFDCSKAVAELQLRERLLAVVHSHPNGPEGPSRWDMQFQMGMDVPWGLVATDGARVGTPFFWGDALPIPPLERRPFRHGPSGTDGKGDCYALIRDYYRVERNVPLVEGERSDDWWLAKDGPNNLYLDNFERAGFRQIEPREPRPGDVVLFTIKSPVPNHGGVYLGQGLLLHHVSRRLSQRVPIGPWTKYLSTWLRHDS